MQFYAHTKAQSNGTPAPMSEWEPLFTPFGSGEEDCLREHCEKSRNLHVKITLQ